MEDLQQGIADYYSEKGLDPEVFQKLGYGFLLVLGYGVSVQVEEKGK